MNQKSCHSADLKDESECRAGNDPSRKTLEIWAKELVHLALARSICE